ncbi:hypothetical protein AX17_003108 [Amanita inopinata Kibby_2008]|nr:hypothetical protein AX17_003108 [Amanita inopinata Kibby_2008]
MTILHACILARDLKTFQRLLNIHGRPSAKTANDDEPVIGADDDSPSPSYTRHTYTHTHGPSNTPGVPNVNVNVNARDRDGRTALHLACSLPQCLEYVRLLLKHPNINVNLPDSESHYTPLHRVMYAANFPAALLLLQRPDIDLGLKDLEGYTAIDLYNSSIEGTKPNPSDLDAELYTWGANVNATLGFPDGKNRSYPDQIVIQPKEQVSASAASAQTLKDRFSPIHVRSIGMSKLHTVVVTSESANGGGAGNLRVCGFGSSGRLGPSPYNHYQQYTLSPLPPNAFPPNTAPIIRVAMGQDHTLALTASGEIYSWGLNRFAQLGYVIKVQVQGEGNSGVGASGEGKAERSVSGEEKAGTGNSTVDDTVQPTPRRIQDALRKEVVMGVAASKMASACWTLRGDVFTWGTNSGQLGYQRSSQPQILPRKVSKIAHPVIDVALTDTAMACLLVTRDVVCMWNDKEIKVNFPIQTFPSKIQPYRPPQALRDADIAKLTACDDVFAALSLNGEVFVFVPPDVNAGSSASGGAGRAGLIKPQRAWVLRKKFRAVRDVALGANGNIIVCTESGHVFVRSRAPLKAANLANQGGDKGATHAGAGTSGSLTSSGLAGGTTTTASGSKIGSNFTFTRIPCLQRVTRVCANSTGAFGALKVGYRHYPIEVVGNQIAEDLKEVMPFVLMYGAEGSDGPDVEGWQRTKKGGRSGLGSSTRKTTDPSPGKARNDVRQQPGDLEADNDADADRFSSDIQQLKHLCKLIELEKKEKKTYPRDGRLPFDADVLVCSQSDAAFPAHRLVLSARSPLIRSVLEGGKALKDEQANVVVRFVANKGKGKTSTPFQSISTCGRLVISGCHTLAILIFLTYLYCDEFLAIWDIRVAMELQKELARLKLKPAQVKAELQVLAKLSDLPLLSEALEPWVKRIPVPSVAKDMEKLWLDTQAIVCDRDDGGTKTLLNDPMAPDVVLQLEDREVWCHSLLLRARSDMFASFLGESVWTMNRWSEDGILKVNMRHMKWHVMRYVLRFICCGTEGALFERLEFANSTDDVLEFAFSVMRAATELLLDRLVLICSSVILEHCNIYNACFILNDATHYNAKQLIERLQTYMLVNLETLLELHMLDDASHRLIKGLATFARHKQAEKSPISRTTLLVDMAMGKHAQWLASQDVPELIAPVTQLRNAGKGVNSAVKRKTSLLRVENLPTPSSSADEPASTVSMFHRSIRRPPSGDDLFIMDDAEGPLTADAQVQGSPGKSSVWKAPSVPRVDMKVVMAEAAASVSSSPTKPKTTSNKSLQVERVPSKDGPGTAASPNHRVASQTIMPSNSALPSIAPPISRTGPLPSELGPAGRKPHSAPATPPRPQRPQMTEKHSNLGPVITPTKQPAPGRTNDTPSIRRVSGKAWTLNPVQPVIAPPQVSSSQAGMSFIAIQQLQLEQAAGPTKDKRSLREIQAEEEERRQEEDFLRWWATEEERVKLENEAVARALQESDQGSPDKSKRKRRNPRGGKSGAGDQRFKLPSGGQGEQTQNSQGKEPGGRGQRPRKPKRSEKNDAPNS